MAAIVANRSVELTNAVSRAPRRSTPLPHTINGTCVPPSIMLSLVRPLVLLMLGINVFHRERLPLFSPVVIIANHNNHIDTFVLMTLFPMDCLKRFRAAAAADHFLRNRVLAWISLNMFGIIPIKRSNLKRGDGNPLDSCSNALKQGETLDI